MSETASDPSDRVHDKFKLQSFIVRMWLEQPDEKARHGIWRGRIIHIPSKRQRYFTDMKIIASFIKSCLKKG